MGKAGEGSNLLSIVSFVEDDDEKMRLQRIVGVQLFTFVALREEEEG